MKILVNSLVLTFLLVSSIVRADGTREIVILDGVPVYFDTMFKPGVKPERVMPKVEKQPDPVPQKIEEPIQVSKPIPVQIKQVEVPDKLVGSIHVTDHDFAAEVDAYKGFVLIDFSATWCGPCQRLSPVVDEMAEKFKGKIKVVKIDVDASPDATRKYSAYAIPKLVIIKDGKTVVEQVGAFSKERFEAWIKTNLDPVTPVPASFKEPIILKGKPFDATRGVIIYNGKPVYKDTIDNSVPELIENYPGNMPDQTSSALPAPQPTYQDASTSQAYRSSPPPFFGGYPVNYNKVCTTG